MKKKQIILSAIVLIAIVGALLVYNFVINPEHRDIASEKATVTISATDIHNQFSTNEAEALNKYLDKVIAVSGTISEIETNAIVLEDKIQVGLLPEENTAIKSNTSITVKGRCVGYDELLEMVKIDQATLTTNTN